MQMVREKGCRGDTLPTGGYGWPASILLVGHQMAAGRLSARLDQLPRAGLPVGAQSLSGRPPVMVEPARRVSIKVQARMVPIAARIAAPR